MTAETLLFTVFAVAAMAGAAAVVVTQNVVRMAFWLIISLGSVSGLFFLADADFVGATQLLIYVGGTLVLLVFGVMLTASGPYLKIKTSPGELILSAGIGLLVLTILIATVVSVDWEASTTVAGESGYGRADQGQTLRPLGLSLLGVRPDKGLSESGEPGASGSPGYLLPFEIVSVHLLVVLIGAAYLARAKRRVSTETDAESV